MTLYCKIASCPYNKSGLYCDKLIAAIGENGACSEFTNRAPQEYVKQEMQNGFRSKFEENKRSDREDADAVNECDSTERDPQETDD